MMGSMVIRDTSPQGQLLSRAYSGLGALASIAMATVLSRWPVAGYTGFLAVIFVAVYIRRFSPRWLGIGMLAFMAYFMGDFLHPKLADLGWIALAAALALAVTHVVSTFLLKDEPERDFRRALLTIDRRVHLILDQLREHADTSLAAADRKALVGEIASLREAVLMAEGFIPQGEGGALAGEGPAAELAVALFELQLAVERVIGASFERAPREDLLRAAQEQDIGPLEQAGSGIGDDSSSTSERALLLLRLVAARKRLEDHLAQSASQAFADAPEIVVPSQKSSGGSGQPTSSGGLVPQSLQLPIQVTSAAAVALVGGLLLSPVRWYWAVITAFIVFNNTQSRSDTLLRAAQRSLGTLGGLVIGSLVATLLGGHMILSIACILLLFFLGFYFLQVSYSAMIFCITIALALIYGVIGMFTPELLVLRLEETLIGAAAGVGAAFLLFGRRASTAAVEKLEGFFDALQEMLEAAQDRLCGRAGDPDLMALSRKIDRSYAELAVVVRPMAGPWRTVTRFGAVRQKLLLLTGCAHWARSLAEALGSGQTIDEQFCAPAEKIIDEIEASIAVGREQGVGLFQHASSESANPPVPSAKRQLVRDTGALDSLDMIERLLGRVVA